VEDLVPVDSNSLYYVLLKVSAGGFCGFPRIHRLESSHLTTTGETQPVALPQRLLFNHMCLASHEVRQERICIFKFGFFGLSPLSGRDRNVRRQIMLRNRRKFLPFPQERTKRTKNPHFPSRKGKFDDRNELF